MIHKNFISQLLIRASKIADANFGHVTGEVKGLDNNQVLTKTDSEIGHLIVSEIKIRFPEHNIIDEESGVIDKKSSYTWVIDPIDGTSNFANGIPMYGIMIGLLEVGTPVAGGVILPFFDELYYAEKGEGAYCNDKKILVSKETHLMNCLVTYAIDGHQENPDMTRKECELLAEIVLNCRNVRMSNSCFDLMMVARGNYAGWVNRTSKIWDNVAPQIIVEEAGGVFTDFVGKRVDYTDPCAKADQNFTECAAPSDVHKKLQEIIQKYIFTN
jgi:myo-inositol-1(or 4)-monophosphatase